MQRKFPKYSASAHLGELSVKATKYLHWTLLCKKFALKCLLDEFSAYVLQCVTCTLCSGGGLLVIVYACISFFGLLTEEGGILEPSKILNKDFYHWTTKNLLSWINRRSQIYLTCYLTSGRQPTRYSCFGKKTCRRIFFYIIALAWVLTWRS